ncbi:hypothetical protein PG993_011738 [Apiospora rasikravindrae]|uniref:Uncharacterized protein n=1 Tax=Apiospora rasikravindrae TaxID=990691 RepID=A0ABR1S0G7_9PEZI
MVQAMKPVKTATAPQGRPMLNPITNSSLGEDDCSSNESGFGRGGWGWRNYPSVVGMDGPTGLVACEAAKFDLRDGDGAASALAGACEF